MIANSGENLFYLHCVVLADKPPIGGLTIYGGESGRSPLPITLIIERSNRPALLRALKLRLNAVEHASS